MARKDMHCTDDETEKVVEGEEQGVLPLLGEVHSKHSLVLGIPDEG